MARFLVSAVLVGASLTGCEAEPPRPVCGDGVVEADEICDPGAPAPDCKDHLTFTQGVARCQSCQAVDLSPCQLTLTLPEQPQAYSCWDLDEDGERDLMSEDRNGDGVVDPKDCQGSDGEQGPRGEVSHCWDLNGNMIGDLDEDRNSDGVFDPKDCQAVAAAPVSSDRLVEVDGANYPALGEVADGTILRFGEDITLTANLDLANRRGLHLVGNAHIKGSTGTEVINLGARSRVTGITFENVTIEGERVLLDGCDFRGTIDFELFRSHIKQGDFRAAIVVKLGELVVENSQFNQASIAPGRAEVSVLASDIVDSTLELSRLMGSDIRDSLLSIEHHASDNTWRDSSIELITTGSPILSQNTFDGPFQDRNHIISVDATVGGVDVVTVEANAVLLGESDVFVRLDAGGEALTERRVLTMIGNTLYRGQALERLGTFAVVVARNIFFRGAVAGVDDDPSTLTRVEGNITLASPL